MEHIVIDGGSIDESVKIIKSYSADVAYWVSEEDGGICDAMNKGIRNASGDYVIFIHSDDFFLDNNTVTEMVSFLSKNAGIAMFQVLYGKSRQVIGVNRFDIQIRIKIPACHQGMLFDRSLFTKLGEYNCHFNICMDYEFILRALNNKVVFQKINYPVSYMDDGGLSSRRDWKSLKARFLEEKEAQHIQSPNFFFSVFYVFYWPSYMLYRKVKFLLT